ncbi:MAG: diacylglycerol kinase family protein [bacterium]
MEKNEVLHIYLNPGFDKRHNGGINKLKKIFSDLKLNIEFVDLNFLKQNIPNENYTTKLLIVGGDGTLHIVLNAIPEKFLEKYIFGILPCGTANEFAKSLNMPKNLYNSCKIIASSDKLSFQHLGLVNKKYKFATGVLYGAPVNVLSTTSDRAKWLLGIRAFYTGFSRFILNFLNKKDFLLKKFILNNKSFSTNFLIINNASLSTKDVTSSELNYEDKNKLSVIYLDANINLKDIFRLAAKHEFKKNILKDKSIHFKSYKKIDIKFKNEIQLTLDGEFYKLKSPLKIEFYPKNLKFIINN